jgi:hypothetical protein
MPPIEGWLRYAVAVAAGYALAVHTTQSASACPPAQVAQAASLAVPESVSRGVRAALSAIDSIDREKEFDLNSATPAAVESSAEVDGVDLDFIEIGTSSFETLIEKVRDARAEHNAHVGPSTGGWTSQVDELSCFFPPERCVCIPFCCLYGACVSCAADQRSVACSACMHACM